MTDARLEGRLREAADELVRSGAERGLQIAVHRHGEPVADVVAGLADAATGRPVTPATPFHGFSAGKAITVTVVHVLAERGLLDYDLPIARVWPEFGAHGKGAATVRDALTHSTGVPGLPADLTPEDLCDWERMCALIAGARPWWEPGARTGYHSYTFGYIAGEIVRRVAGAPISEVLRQEVAGPLGAAGELFLGAPRAELGRFARLEDAPGYDEAPDGSPALAVAPRGVWPSAAFGNRADVLSAPIPAGGQMTARAMARMYAALLGPVDGVRLISANRLRDVTRPLVDDVDQVFGNRAVLSCGFAVGRLGADPGDARTVFGWPGAGGSYACADTATGVAFAVVKNRLTADFGTAQTIARIVADA
ncbi:CubicO group peptidase, beta-lactamase class C family [Nonomuraea solani]|uniref:CubicO group peptidase, beta-lactamase class C family n=1 Tax=Nonomuraea solani TaxID=1144553 RepID=A0A1H6BUR7_9ACTN|nr:serine hydrolase domain-containing protein [Nonomuraea solani]SEG64195.1 CubicO group peptidase, beta-lactamase class C family [Nonomuraea solani]